MPSGLIRRRNLICCYKPISFNANSGVFRRGEFSSSYRNVVFSRDVTLYILTIHLGIESLARCSTCSVWHTLWLVSKEMKKLLVLTTQELNGGIQQIGLGSWLGVKWKFCRVGSEAVLRRW